MANKPINILYIDDDEHNLNAFKAAFRRDYKIFTSINTEDAIEFLKNEEIHIIFADQRMPKITGAEFFALIREEFPNPVRILITGYADISAVIDAINKGQIYRYLSKPWNENDVRVAIENAMEIYETRAELKNKIEELQKSYDELDKFVYSASHDMTAPLMSILGLIEIAKIDAENSENYFLLIERSVRKLEKFVKNIIDYHRNIKSEAEIQEIKFLELINEIIADFNFYPNADQIKFEVNVQQQQPFYCDPERLKIVLNNLISNAIKYQDSQKSQQIVNISVSVEDHLALLTIADNGIGIKEEHLDKIFDMFFRASHENAGTGIGLYIVKEVVKRLNGKISVESENGKGTKFTIEIPRHDTISGNPSSNVDR